MSNLLRTLPSKALRLTNGHGGPTTGAGSAGRTFHSPFAILGTKAPLTSPPPPHQQQPLQQQQQQPSSTIYEKQIDHNPEPTLSHAGTRTYVVSQPDVTSKFYEVPSGAYPTSAPYVNFVATEAPDVQSGGHSSTSSDLLAHSLTSRAVRHDGGVGESGAVRNGDAPGEMGARGGGQGGIGLMDKEGTVAGIGGGLADRNPPPLADNAEQMSKAGIDNAWKSRK